MNTIEVTVVEGQASRRDNTLVDTWTVACPCFDCKISITSVTSVATVLEALQVHLRVSHKLEVTVQRVPVPGLAGDSHLTPDVITHRLPS
jgi:hypothetical protein